MRWLLDEAQASARPPRRLELFEVVANFERKGIFEKRQQGQSLLVLTGLEVTFRIVDQFQVGRANCGIVELVHG